MDIGAGGKPTGKYAERMLAGAWCESNPADLYAARDEWNRLRDEARDTHAELKNNAAQLREVLGGDGFDALHRDRELVTRNYELLADTRADAANIMDRAGDQAANLRRYMISTVTTVQNEIALIEADPITPDTQKQLEIDALVESTNKQLKAFSEAEAAVLTSQLAAHSAMMSALPWHVSTANASPFTPSTHPAGNGVQALSTGWKQAPVTSGNGNGTGPRPGTAPGSDHTGGQEQQQSRQPEKVPGSDHTGGQDQQQPRQPEKVPGESNTSGQEPGTRLTAPPKVPAGMNTSGGAGPEAPLTLPPLGGGASGSGGGSGLGLGGVRGGFPQGLPPSQLSGLPPLSGVPPAPPAALSSPGAVSAPGGSSALAGPRASVPVPVQPVSGVPAAPVQPAMSPAGAPAVTPAGASSPPPAALPATSAAPAAVPLAPAPALAGPPPVPPAAVSPVGPAPAPPVVPATPFHGPPLPPIGTAINRDGLVERAEDPDIVRAKSLIWECLWHGRRYPMLDWAVGLHRGANGTVFYLTSSEGFPFIPQHVHLPDSPALTTPFDDGEFMPYHRAVMLAGWRNPTRIVLGHHALRAGAGLSTLWAIVSSVPLEADHLRPEGTDRGRGPVEESSCRPGEGDRGSHVGGGSSASAGGGCPGAVVDDRAG